MPLASGTALGFDALDDYAIMQRTDFHVAQSLLVPGINVRPFWSGW